MLLVHVTILFVVVHQRLLLVLKLSVTFSADEFGLSFLLLPRYLAATEPVLSYS